MPLAPGELPCDVDCERLDRLGFDDAEAVPEGPCVRFPYLRGRTGILYASHVPIPWGVYWRGPTQIASVAWCRSLDTALELLLLVQ